ncbi:hypothetical protein F4801DRAFT_525223 [Xylaria longipes]|nr:hypothetical protein F4801DRAFT_525223 [Xylaria longipes]
MMASADNVVRCVGSQAQWNTARHSLGILRAVIVTCRYRVSTTHLRQQSLSLYDAIENALAAVVLRQAMLCVGIAGENTKEPAFVHVKTIDMRRMIEWRELIPTTTPITGIRADKSKNEENQAEAHYKDRLLRSLEKHHEALWEDLADKPGWKIVVHHDPRQLGALQSEENDVLLSFDISFCFHHAYADGKSGYIFHGDFQRALSNAACPPELQNHILYLPTAPILPPAMDTLIPFSLSWAFILRTAWAEILYPVLVPPFLRRLLHLEPSEADLPWTGGPVDGSNPKGHIRTLLDVDEAQLQRILARCRSHKASLTGLLHALIARSLARLVRDKSFHSTTPISLARYADPGIAGSTFTPDETIHCLVTGLLCDHELATIRRLQQGQDSGDTRVQDDAAMWAFAQDMTARIRDKAASLPRDDITALYGLVGDWHEFLRNKFGKARSSSWELSNLGSLSAVDSGVSVPEDLSRAESERRVENEGRWFIDRAVFTQGMNAIGPAVSFNVAGVAEHGICVTVNWQNGIVDVDLAEKLVDDLQASVAELGEA